MGVCQYIYSNFGVCDKVIGCWYKSISIKSLHLCRCRHTSSKWKWKKGRSWESMLNIVEKMLTEVKEIKTYNSKMLCLDYAIYWNYVPSSS